MNSVSPQEISDFLEEEIADKGLSAKAFGNLKSITKEFLKRAKKRKLITYNVMGIFNELDVSDVNFKRKHKKDSEEVFFWIITWIIGQMGHTSILCTENYYHRNRRNLENKQQIIRI